MNVLFINYILEILRCVCYNCSRVLINKHSSKYEALNADPDPQRRFDAFKRNIARRISRQKYLRCAFLDPVTKEADSCCFHQQPKYKKKGNSIEIEFQGKKPQLFREAEIKKIIDSIDESDFRILALEGNHPDGFITSFLPIPPNPLRPANKNATHNKEGERTAQLHEIIKTSRNLERNLNNKGKKQISKSFSTNQYCSQERKFYKKEEGGKTREG